MSQSNPQAQVEAVMDVLAPYVEGPPGYAQVRWPIFRFMYDDQPIMPNDEQVRALAERIVTVIRTAGG